MDSEFARISNAHIATHSDFESFASVGMLTGDARFICSRGGLAVITNSIRLMAEIFTLTLDPQGVAEEMSRFIPERYKQRTPWGGVRRIPPGCKAYLRNDNSWEVEPIPNPYLNIAHDTSDLHNGELKLALKNAIERAIDGALGVTADLSGGMDSSSICSILSELGREYTPSHVVSSDDGNLDFHYAKIAADAFGKALHPLGGPVSGGAFDSEFHGSPAAIADGIPTWVGGDEGYARRARFSAERSHDRYLLGIGGDELFSMQYGALLAADTPKNRYGGYRTLLKSISAAGTVRGNTRMLLTSQRSPGEEAKARLSTEGGGSRVSSNALADLGWMPGLDLPSYLDSSLKLALREQIINFSESDDFPLHTERFKHVILESLIKQANTLASVNRNFGSEKLSFHAPFLDPLFVLPVLSLKSHEFSPRNGHKHILKAIVGKSLPPEIRERPEKGELSSELYESFTLNRDTVRRQLSDSYLVDLGVVSGEHLQSVISRPVYSTSSLMELEELYHAEKWVRTINSNTSGGYIQ